MSRPVFVLVGGWPGSGKTTLAAALAEALDLPLLAKDDVKLALMDALGAPATVEESQRLGRAAVLATLTAAAGCRSGAVVDSTWYDYTLELVRRLPGSVVEVRCVVDVAVARRRYDDRLRDARHLDRERSDQELWGAPVEPLGVGPLVEVDTSVPVDVAAVAAVVARLDQVTPATTASATPTRVR